MRRSILISLLLMGLGTGVLSWVSWPIISFHVFAAPLLTSVVSPVGIIRSDTIINSSQKTQIDYTNPNIWFPLKPQKKVESKINEYMLSIPQLGIINAKVEIGGNDLNKALIHYGGTAFPGEIGNAAIFGHSVLPQFFNSKNYKTIFSTLPTIEIGNDIFLTFDQITYRYRVENISVRSPQDLSMLDQPTNDAYITLITCVPPGTYWERLHVRAKLVRL
jgi:sortase A